MSLESENSMQEKSQKMDSGNISGLSKTLLIPVWARAVETQRPDGIIQDPYAVKISQTYDYDFSSYEKEGWKSQFGIAIRTRIFDRAVAKFIATNPNGIVVNMGCGFDGRCYRLDNGHATWFDLDLPQVITERKKFFNEDERHIMLANSALSTEWHDSVSSEKPVLFVAEGFSMFFPEQELKKLVRSLSEAFPGSEFLFDALSPKLVGKAKSHDTISKCSGVEFKWGMDDGTKLCSWTQKIQLVEDFDFFESPLTRWRWMAFFKLIPQLRNLMKVYHYRFMTAA